VEDSVSHRRFGYLDRTCEAELVATQDLVEELRRVKEPAEVERIAAAQELTDAAFDHVLGVVRSGMTEREIALALEFHMRERGSEGVAFPPIVASGPNSARPHATVSDRRLQHGDFVVLDFGARVGGYCADMTRTLVVGKASDEQRQLYDAVYEANRAGTAAIRAGVLGKDADAAAREVLEGRGLGDLFTHGLGHGVGLEVHELPGVGPRGEKELPAGSVVTVEPGAYEAERGGVRIEDLVVVEEGGCRVLTRSPKDLIEI
jgi:Xaa-Pro aminopeptidase